MTADEDRVKAIRDGAKAELLEYLIGVAQNTQGAEVWRALFAEILGQYLTSASPSPSAAAPASAGP